MRRYPKGCRYIQVVNGVILPKRKTTRACDIDDLHARIIAVQPRGKLKWFVFRGERWVMRLVDTGHDPDPLLIKALLLDGD